LIKNNKRRRGIKKITSMIACGLLLYTSCYAQEKTAVPRPAQPEAEIRTIYQYKAELGLTDKQEGDLKKLLGDFQDYFTEKKKEMTALQEELGEMIKVKEDIKKIRKLLEDIALIQVDASCFDIETSRGVEGVLTPQQLAQWRAIQMDFQKEAQSKQKTAGAGH
jgi:Spy/CpxP family protein refolding chaperone